MADDRVFGRAGEAADDDHWIGPRPSMAQIIAFLTIGSIGLIIAGVQPILLQALVDEHRLTAAMLGWTMTVEFLTLGVGVGLAGALFPPRHLRLIGLAAALVLMVMDGLVATQAGAAVMANRALAGLAEGVLVWLTTLMIARSATPARWGGIFLVIQGVMQVAFALILPVTLMNTLGANGGFYALAGTAALAGLAVFALPNAMAPLGSDPSVARGEGAAAKLALAAIASLAAVFLIYAFFIGFFAYLPQLGGQARLTPAQIGVAVSLTLATSITGSGVAAAVARRISYYAAFLASLVVFAFTLAVLATLPGAQLFIVTAALYGFFWGFFMPFQLPLVIEADPTRRAALLVPGIQALGAAGGPLLCSFFITDHEARGALVVPGLCLAASFFIATALHLRRLAQGRSPVATALDFTP